MALASAGRIKAGAAYIELTTNNHKLLAGLQKAQVQIRTFGQSLKGVGADMMQTAGAIALPLAYSIKGFAAFDDKIKALRAISGATPKEIQKLMKLIRHLGGTTAFTAQQVAEGAVSLSRLGFSASELTDGIKPAMDLVRATGEETYRLGELSEYAAANLRIFSLHSSDFSDVCDVMAYAANGSAMNIQDLGEAMKIAGPSAFSVNENIRDTAAALMLLANAGVKGSLAGTSLRKIYQSLAAQSGMTEGLSPDQIAEGIRGNEQLAAMGIKVIDPDTGNLRKAADIMIDLAKRVKAMKSGQKINFATDVFDLRGSLGALSMLNNPKELANFRKALDNIEGYAAKTAEEMERGIGGVFRFIISQFQEMQLAIGDAFQETFMPYLKKIPLITQAITYFVKEHKDLVSWIVLGISSIAALGVILFGLGAIIKIIASVLGGLIIALKLFVTTLLLPVTLIKGVVLVFAGFKAVLLALAPIIAALFTPLGLLTAALAAGGIMLGKYTGLWEQTGAVAQSAASDFKTAFRDIKGIAVESFGIIKESLAAGDFAGAAKVGLAALQLAWRKGIFPLEKKWIEFKNFMVDSFEVSLHALANIAVDTWYGMLTGLERFGRDFATLWKIIAKSIGDVWRSSVSGTSKGLLKALNWLSYGASVSFNHIVDMYEWLTDGKINKAGQKLRAREAEKMWVLGEEAEKQLDGLNNAEQKKVDDTFNKAIAELSQPVDISEWDAIKANMKKMHAAELAKNKHYYGGQIADAKKGISDAETEYNNAKNFAASWHPTRAISNAMKKMFDDYLKEASRMVIGDPDLKKGFAALRKNPARAAEVAEKKLADERKKAVELKDLFFAELDKAAADRNIDDNEQDVLRIIALDHAYSQGLMQNYQKILEQANKAVGENMEKSGVEPKSAKSPDAVGAWSLRALQGLVGKTAAERTANATERSASATERNVRLQEKNNKNVMEILQEVKELELRYS